MIRHVGLIVCTMLFLNAFGQQSVELYNIGSHDNLNAEALGLNTYRKIKVNLSNSGSSDKKINIPCGTFFENGNPSEQGLVVLFKEKVNLGANASTSIELTTACMDASKAAPSSHSNWTIKNDKGLGDLIRYYHSNRSTIALMTGNEHHSTREKQINFLQMAVWSYYDCDRKHIVNFATDYMFDGDRDSAESFVDTTLPLIRIFTNLYKTANR